MKLLTGITELWTFHGAAQKAGRNPSLEDLSPIKNAAILIKGKDVIWVGPEKDFSKTVFKRKKHDRVRLKNAFVMPALIDPHSHTVFGGNRQNEFELRNRGYSYQEVADQGGGIMATVRATRQASEKQLLHMARQREQKYLCQGVATVEIKSGYGLDLKNELKILNVARQLKHIRTVPTFLGAHTIPPEFESTQEYLEAILTWLPKIRKVTDRVDIFIEQSYFSREDAAKLYKAARNLGFQLLAHADQLNSTGASVFAAEEGAVSVDHCVHLKDPEVLRLAKTETTCVLLPGSDFYLRISYPPARRMIEAGVRVSLGTDFNPGSCPTQDLSLIGVLARLEMKMTLPEVLVAMTVNAAFALGLSEQLGSIEPGKRADFVVLDEPIHSLFYEVGHHPVRSLWKEGRRIFDKK